MSRPMSSGSPSAQIIRADCIVSALRSSDTPTNWPRPLRSRSYSADDDAGGDQRRGVVVDHRAVDDLRRAAALALQRAHAGHRLQHLVVAGLVLHRPGLAVAGDRAIDQARIDRAQLLVVDAQPLRARWGGSCAPARRPRAPAAAAAAQPGGLLQVERDAELAAVDADEGAALGLPASTDTCAGCRRRAARP